MRKKSKYKSKGVRPDLVNWVLSGLKPMNSVTLTTDLRIKNHSAMDTLRRGDATRNEIDVLIGMMNMTEAYTRLRPEFGKDWAVEIREAQDALYAVARRGVESGRFILKASELKALNLVMELHDEQLNLSTVRDMEKAMDIINLEFQNRLMRPIVERQPA
jgi:hypothetical protein